MTAFGTGMRTYGGRSVPVYNKPAVAVVEVADDSDVNFVVAMNFDSGSGCLNSHLYQNITVDLMTAVKLHYHSSNSEVNLDFLGQS